MYKYYVKNKTVKRSNNTQKKKLSNAHFFPKINDKYRYDI